MIDTATLQAIAAVGVLMLALITLIGTWVSWLVRGLRVEICRNYQELVTYLQGHTHGDAGAAVFHRLPAAGD